VPITHAFIGSYHDWDLSDPDEPIDVVKKYLPVHKQETGPFFGQGLQQGQYMKIDPEAWTFGKMAAKIIADAVAAAESTGGQGELPAAELLPEPLVSLIELELSPPVALSPLNPLGSAGELFTKYGPQADIKPDIKADIWADLGADMIVKKNNTGEFSGLADRAFWAHCKTVAAEVSLWPKWMRGEVKITAAVARKRR
jgi:hypothetical protein